MLGCVLYMLAIPHKQSNISVSHNNNNFELLNKDTGKPGGRKDTPVMLSATNHTYCAVALKSCAFPSFCSFPAVNTLHGNDAFRNGHLTIDERQQRRYRAACT